MNYVLMHKNINVVELEISEKTAKILKVGKTYDLKHLPVAVKFKKDIVDKYDLENWWKDRSIPASRMGVQNALQCLNIVSPQILLTQCFGLSLSDQYWIKPTDSTMQWEDINFFENEFSQDIGDVLLGIRKDSEGINFASPDNTSDGYLKKRWKIVDGKRCLIKGGSDPYLQQPFNEVIASIIMKRLEINCVQYDLMWDNGEPFSVCEDFIDKNTELVSAWRIINTKKKNNNTSLYQHYVNCCKEYGINNIEQSLNEMIVIDYIVANEDRHLNNFGLIRNADTLEWIGVAPIFDTGSSLGYDKLISRFKYAKCKPFKNSHEEQIKLVTTFDWIDFESLNDIGMEIKSVFESDKNIYVDEERQDAIIRSIEKRINLLQEMSLKIVKVEDNIEDDIEENVAETYVDEISM